MKTFKDLLIELNACSPAIVWAEDKNIEEVLRDSYRGDWLLWLAKKLDLPLNKLTLAKARCAKTVIHLMKDKRSVDAVNVAEKFGLDECTLEELNNAYAAANSAQTEANPKLENHQSHCRSLLCFAFERNGLVGERPTSEYYAWRYDD